MELKVGDSLVITGKLDGKEYFLWALKEPSYNEDDGNGRAATCG
jgi:hypothetical protein